MSSVSARAKARKRVAATARHELRTSSPEIKRREEITASYFTVSPEDELEIKRAQLAAQLAAEEKERLLQRAFLQQESSRQSSMQRDPREVLIGYKIILSELKLKQIKDEVKRFLDIQFELVRGYYNYYTHTYNGIVDDKLVNYISENIINLVNTWHNVGIYYSTLEQPILSALHQMEIEPNVINMYIKPQLKTLLDRLLNKEIFKTGMPPSYAWPTQGGNAKGPVASDKRVTIDGKKRVVYVGSRGGKYIKKGGTFVSL